MVALIGGVLGIPGAMFNELLHGSVLVTFVGAPIIEEILKPCGVYLLLAKWPHALRRRLYTAILAALAGFAFSLIENTVYFNLYIDDPSDNLLLWRYTVCVGTHTLFSFIFELGINEKLLASINGQSKFLSYGKRFFFTAIALHSLYNIPVTVFEQTLNTL